MIALGSDHGGYSLKQEVKAYLEGKEFRIKTMAVWMSRHAIIRFMPRQLQRQ